MKNRGIRCSESDAAKDRSAVAQPVEQVLDRLCRAVIEASKQCGRNRLMEIQKPQNWAEFVEDFAAEPCRLLAHPQGFHRGAGPLPHDKPRKSVVLAVGPEGGFSPHEIGRAVAAGWHTINLGRRILRIETARAADGDGIGVVRGKGGRGPCRAVTRKCGSSGKKRLGRSLALPTKASLWKNSKSPRKTHLFPPPIRSRTKGNPSRER